LNAAILRHGGLGGAILNSANLIEANLRGADVRDAIAVRRRTGADRPSDALHGFATSGHLRRRPRLAGE
jgi:uncharacterized protein YjbI with pentapeptide repeats